jgi:uncharacterized RDD family membrane protein YckC
MPIDPIVPPPLPPPVYAGFWWRVLAWFLDALIISLCRCLPGVTAGDSWFALIPQVIIGWLYFSLMESSRHQATVGKLVCGLRVTDEAGRRIGFARATGRHFAKILDALTLGIGFLMVAFTRRKQGLHDLVARTLVVRLR